VTLPIKMKNRWGFKKESAGSAKRTASLEKNRERPHDNHNQRHLLPSERQNLQLEIDRLGPMKRDQGGSNLDCHRADVPEDQ